MRTTEEKNISKDEFMVMNVPTTTPNNNGRVSTVTTPPPLMPVAPGAQTPHRPSPSPHSSPITLGPRPPCTTTSVSESDRNNNATPPSNRSSLSLPPPPPVIPNARRAAIQPRSPPVGARQKDLPPGAAPIGSIAMPPRPPIPSTSSQAMSVPLLACQLGRPVNLGERGPPGPLAGGPRPLGGIPPVSPHHISNLLSHTLFAAIPTGNGRIMARNINGTLAVTSHPSNESELQIYRVLQRANLLSYYDTFIAQGGDDVQQLCEAGEAEFLEIMDLVGMASKPMHVRRLQKALQEWVHNPAIFNTPLVPLSNLSAPSAAAAVIRASSTVGGPGGITAPPTNAGANAPPPLCPRPSNNDPLAVTSSPLMSASVSGGRNRSVSPPSSAMMGMEKSASSAPHSPSPVGSLISKENNNSQQGGMPSPTYSQSGADYPPLSSSPLQLTPSLVESQIQRIANTAETLINAMSPAVEAKQLKNNKKISKEVERVLALSDDDPLKMEEIRRFSAIYGRFDCKRKPEKPLTLHEVSVNEAAAQLTMRKPLLLMRRDELFPLARQVVRDSGYQYSKGHSRSQFQAGYPSKIFGLGKSGDEDSSNGAGGSHQGSEHPIKKRPRFSDCEDGLKQNERYERIHEELRHLSDRMEELKTAATHARDANDLNALHNIGQQIEMIQNRQALLLREQHQERQIRASGRGRVSTSSDPERPDTDEDSQMSYSNTSSPNPHSQGSYVLSTSGGQIIAVQNPALSMSGALPMRTSPTSPATCAPSSGGNPRVGGDHPNATATNLVNLLNLTRQQRSDHVNTLGMAGSGAIAGNGRDNSNAKKIQASSTGGGGAAPSTIVHSDEDEMTFKQEPASPPPPPSSVSERPPTASELRASSPRPPSTNGKN